MENLIKPSTSTTKNFGADSSTANPISLKGGVPDEPEKVTWAVSAASPVPKPILPELSILAESIPLEPM